MSDVECITSVLVSTGDGTHTAAMALFDTGANDFIKSSFLSSIDPHGSLLIHYPSETSLGNWLPSV